MRVWMLVVVMLAGCSDTSSSTRAKTRPGVEPAAQAPPAGDPQDARRAKDTAGEAAAGAAPVDEAEVTFDRVFAVHDAFPPLPKPGEHDWLANHKEPGQSVAGFVASRPNRPKGKRKVIYLLPLGTFDATRSPSMRVLADYTRAYYAMKVKVLPAVPINKLRATERMNGGQRQLLTTDILRYLKKHVPDDAYCLIGLTQIDLYPEPSWNFVFGQATLRDRVGVYSFARYHPAFYGQKADKDTRKQVLLRSLKVMAHEIGHMFGIEHCIFFHCVLNGSNNLEETDRAPIHICPYDLRKLWHSIGFDPVARYQALGAFYRKHKLTEQARWIDGRLAEIAGTDR